MFTFIFFYLTVSQLSDERKSLTVDISLYNKHGGYFSKKKNEGQEQNVIDALYS